MRRRETIWFTPRAKQDTELSTDRMFDALQRTGNPLLSDRCGRADAGRPFPSYARLLPHCGTPERENRYSWRVDFAARRAEMQPQLDQAAALKAAVVDPKEQLKRLKKEKPSDAELAARDTRIRENEKAARELETKAADIDAAVFDLKAVNPNVVARVDDRTPTQIIQNIEAQGRIVAESLARLRSLLAAAD